MDSILKPNTEAVAGDQPLKHTWETFCGAATGYSGGDPVTATDAYLAAFPDTTRDAARANAARLAAKPEIAARCTWMRSQLSQSILMDSAAVRAKITSLRLEIIDKTRHTCHKELALQAARDLEKGLGLGAEQAPVEITVNKQGDARETIGSNVAAALALVNVTIGRKD
jgi:hypothetical protein